MLLISTETDWKYSVYLDTMKMSILQIPATAFLNLVCVLYNKSDRY